MKQNSKWVGERSEAQIIARCVEKELSISVPFGNNQRYDLLIDAGDKILKVQCKTATRKNGSLLFPVMSTNGFTGEHRDYKGEIDIFLAYSHELKKIYKIDIGEANSRYISLRLDPISPKTPKFLIEKIKWAKDYEF